MTLSALIQKSEIVEVATAIPAIPATQATWEWATVAKIATVAVANPTNCEICTHSRRPGGATRHCAARPELPPAYGPRHPLRLIPDDDGAGCVQFEARIPDPSSRVLSASGRWYFTTANVMRKHPSVSSIQPMPQQINKEF
jgi:hypothetical protein